MNEPLVSILIVTYNAERYIETTLRSCVGQTYKNTEILLWDNASTDGTKEAIQRVKDSRVTILSSANNLGPYQALNQLLAVAKGELVAIQDHDDLWLPGKLEEQIRCMKDHPEIVACGTLTFYYYEDRQILLLPKNPEQTLFVDHTSLMFRYGDARYDTSQPLPDEHFERITLHSRGKLICLQQGLTIHRIRNDGQNFSTFRVRSNIRGGWSHFRLTGYRDFSGLFMFLVQAYIPKAFLWWIRKHVTLRGAEWLTTQQFTERYNFSL